MLRGQSKGFCFVIWWLLFKIKVKTYSIPYDAFKGVRNLIMFDPSTIVYIYISCTSFRPERWLKTSESHSSGGEKGHKLPDKSTAEKAPHFDGFNTLPDFPHFHTDQAAIPSPSNSSISTSYSTTPQADHLGCNQEASFMPFGIGTRSCLLGQRFAQVRGQVRGQGQKGHWVIGFTLKGVQALGSRFRLQDLRVYGLWSVMVRV